jgi:hypothetical protein
MRTLLHLVAAVLLLATQVWGACGVLPAAPHQAVQHGMMGRPDVLVDVQVVGADELVLVWHDRITTLAARPSPAPSTRPRPAAQAPTFHPRRPPPRGVATDSSDTSH